MGNEGNEALRGIFSPRYDREVIDRYLHTLFLEQAQDYAEKYAATAYFSQLLSDAFEKIGLQEEQRSGLRILDIGSGAGNSIFPLLALCPDSQIIASDLSVDLLALLKNALAGMENAASCGLLQLNAEELDFIPESFDLVIGAAILHHLLSPQKVFAGCARILKRGGYAIFFEPFEAGNAILGLLYRAILQDPRSMALPTEVTTCLRSHIAQGEIRKGRDKTPPVFERLDDKWLFTRHYIEEMASHYGLSPVQIYPLHTVEHPFTQQTEVNLRLAIGRQPDALPKWAWEIIQTYDHRFSEDLKSDLLIEGGIILTK